MKKITLSGATLLIAGILFLSVSCKKADDSSAPAATTTTTADDSGTQKVAASDEAAVSTESDKSLEEVNTAIGTNTTISGKTEETPPCGASIDSSGKATGLLVINYDPKVICADSSFRSGSISVQKSNSMTWKTKGASFTITYLNYTITRKGKATVLNGTKTITNLSGYLLYDLYKGTVSTLTHKVKGSLVIKFDDGTTRTWAVTRYKLYTKLPSTAAADYSITMSGDSATGVLFAGTNRAGNNFTVVIPSANPIVIKKSCGWSKPVSGQKVHKGLDRELTVTFGVDNTGLAMTGGACAYGYKLNWTNAKGEAKQAVINY